MTERKKNPIGNRLRADLYTRLLPDILREDQKSGVGSFVRFWDDPLNKWDDTGFWDELGILPVLKNIFYAIESEEVLDLEEIDQLTDLVDPNKCPDKFLDIMARSLGHPLEEGLTEPGKRDTIKSIIQLHKSRGRELSWDVFFRMVGFTVRGIPLWKEDIYEENDSYSRVKTVQDTISNEVIGSSGLTDYSGTLTERPIRPGSILVKASGKVYRDQGDDLSSNFGKMVSTDGSTGSFNYARGKYELKFSSATTTQVTISYDHITAEFPYRAARVDLEVDFLLTEEGGRPFDDELLDKILERLEEVRPIHVLVRLVILVLDAPETLENFVTDNIVCGPSMGKDVRSKEYRFYAADAANAPQEGVLIIEKDGATLEREYHVEDPVNLCVNPDKLVIEFSDGSPPQYW